MAETKHSWEAELTSYRPSEDAPDFMALVYDPAPGGRKNKDGTTSYSMRFPALILTEYVGDAKNAAEQLARELNAYSGLLEALKGVRANLVRLSWEENSIMIEGIDAAIAKAEAPALTQPGTAL